MAWEGITPLHVGYPVCLAHEGEAGRGELHPCGPAGGQRHPAPQSRAGWDR